MCPTFWLRFAGDEAVAKHNKIPAQNLSKVGYGTSCLYCPSCSLPSHLAGKTNYNKNGPNRSCGAAKDLFYWVEISNFKLNTIVSEIFPLLVTIFQSGRGGWDEVGKAFMLLDHSQWHTICHVVMHVVLSMCVRVFCFRDLRVLFALFFLPAGVPLSTICSPLAQFERVLPASERERELCCVRSPSAYSNSALLQHQLSLHDERFERAAAVAHWSFVRM